MEQDDGSFAWGEEYLAHMGSMTFWGRGLMKSMQRRLQTLTRMTIRLSLSLVLSMSLVLAITWRMKLHNTVKVHGTGIGGFQEMTGNVLPG
jgi:hypothetical protein